MKLGNFHLAKLLAERYSIWPGYKTSQGVKGVKLGEGIPASVGQDDPSTMINYGKVKGGLILAPIAFSSV